MQHLFLPTCCLFSIDSECQAFCTATSFEKLIQLNLHRPISSKRQTSGQLRTTAVMNNSSSNDDCIAAEPKSLGFVYGYELWDVCLEDPAAICIESFRKIQCLAW